MARHVSQFLRYVIYYGARVERRYVRSIIVPIGLTQSLERVEVTLAGQVQDGSLRICVLDGVNRREGCFEVVVGYAGGGSKDQDNLTQGSVSIDACSVRFVLVM